MFKVCKRKRVVHFTFYYVGRCVLNDRTACLSACMYIIGRELNSKSLINVFYVCFLLRISLAVRMLVIDFIYTWLFLLNMNNGFVSVGDGTWDAKKIPNAHSVSVSVFNICQFW